MEFFLLAMLGLPLALWFVGRTVGGCLADGEDWEVADVEVDEEREPEPAERLAIA